MPQTPFNRIFIFRKYLLIRWFIEVLNILVEIEAIYRGFVKSGKTPHSIQCSYSNYFCKTILNNMQGSL